MYQNRVSFYEDQLIRIPYLMYMGGVNVSKWGVILREPLSEAHGQNRVRGSSIGASSFLEPLNNQFKGRFETP